MIEVCRQKDGFIVSGHAHYAEPGKDIVCAAVSALLQTFLASAERLTEDEIKSEYGAGYAYISYENLSERAAVLLDSFFIGVSMIAEEYPEYVRIV